jgi:hypothetical protein
MTVGTRAPGNIGNGQLVFNRYGNDYFLARAFWSGYSNGQEVLKSKRELEIAQTSKPEPLKLNLSGGLVR